MHVVNWPVLRPVIKRKSAMISLSVVAKGGNTSDGLTHTSVGSRFSALVAKCTQMHTGEGTSARPQLCYCDSSIKSDKFAAERERTWMDLPKLNCREVTLITCHLSHSAS